VVVLAVNSGASATQIKRHFEKEKYTFKALRQKQDDVSKAYGVKTYPVTYVVGADGKIVARMAGFSVDALRGTLEKVAPKK
jgi:peroxiredoxin